MTKARTLADNFAADINGITAGTGISGGGTSGTVTVTNSMATAIDAKGDLVVGTGADTFSRLAVASTAGYLLSVDSGEATGLKWAAPAGGGKVLQVVQDDDTSGFSTASTSFQDTGLSVTITPSSASSKVLITVAGIYGYVSYNGSSTANYGYFRLVRTSTQLQEIAGGAYNLASSSNKVHYINANFGYLDSPATTSAITYKVQGRCDAANYTVAYVASATQIASIIAYEIGA